MKAIMLAALAALAACATPPLSIELAIDGQTCSTTACSDIPVSCPTMVFVRILDPDDPSEPYVSQCLPVLQTTQHDLCPVAGVQLSPVDAMGQPIVLPEKTLEVQVVVLPLATGSNGTPDCGPDVAGLAFADATGLPEAEAGAPPIGGRAYYRPGDATTVVDLGCNDITVLDHCSVTNALTVDATVDDFPTDLPVTATVADDLAVSVGEPTPVAVGTATQYMLPTTATTQLALTATMPAPAWSATVDQTFQVATCIEVVDLGVAETTPTLACVPAMPGATSLDFDGKAAPAGIHLSRDLLQQLTAALAEPDFSLDTGFVVGIVLDADGSPIANQVVAASDPTATVQYLDATGSAYAGTATSTNGIFVSTDASFDTAWTTQQGVTLVTTGFGGLVDGMVTVVVLQLASSPHS
jgi:hypothetical protein